MPFNKNELSSNIENFFGNGEKHTGKKFAILIDPDRLNTQNLEKTVRNATENGADYFFVGGSLLLHDDLDRCLDILKEQSGIPVILFPGSTFQLNKKADAVFFLSVISGRNPELLIGQHVIAAPYLKESGLDIVPTGYMIIDGGKPTAASYISGTQPIPADKPEIASCTALAGEMLGLRVIYMDAGSGAKEPASVSMIKEVKKQISIPLIVGGGIKTPDQARERCKAGADVIVIGNAIENDTHLIREMAQAIHATEHVHK